MYRIVLSGILAVTLLPYVGWEIASAKVPPQEASQLYGEGCGSLTPNGYGCFNYGYACAQNSLFTSDNVPPCQVPFIRTCANSSCGSYHSTPTCFGGE